MWKKIAGIAAGIALEKGVDALKEYSNKVVSDKKSTWDSLKNSTTESVSKKFEDITLSSQKERSSVFSDMMEVGGEATQSWFHRSFPTLAKLYGTFEALSEDSLEEKHPLEHDLQIFGSFSLFVPDFMLSIITDPLKEYVLGPLLNSGFYPQSEKLMKKIKSEDPDDVVDVLLTINQDIVTGQVTMDKIWKNLISKAF